MVEVREATLTDIPAMIDMGEKFFNSGKWPSSMKFNSQYLYKWALEALNNEDVLMLVSDDRTAMCGAIAHTNYFTGSLLVGELFWWVEPTERSKGLGMSMFSRIEEWAKEIGAEAVSMAALDKDDLPLVDSIYRAKGYTRSEIAYVKGL